MKLGVSKKLSDDAPELWAQKLKSLGLSAVVFPCRYQAPTAEIDAYVKACRDFDLTIAEVGSWKNILVSDPQQRAENRAYCKGQLELAEYVGAKCCVNISGSRSEIWDGASPENYSEATYAEIVSFVQQLIDSVKPQKTFYTLEPMPWMHPDSPEDYLQMIRDIDRSAFAVHLDVVNMLSTPKRYLFNEAFTSRCFELLGKYIKSCHIKDVRLDRHLTVRLEESPCGQGGFNLRHYLSEIDKLDPDMPVIIEHLATEEQYLDAVRYVQSIYK